MLIAILVIVSIIMLIIACFVVAMCIYIKIDTKSGRDKWLASLKEEKILHALLMLKESELDPALKTYLAYRDERANRDTEKENQPKG